MALPRRHRPGSQPSAAWCPGWRGGRPRWRDRGRQCWWRTSALPLSGRGWHAWARYRRRCSSERGAWRALPSWHPGRIGAGGPWELGAAGVQGTRLSPRVVDPGGSRSGVVEHRPEADGEVERRDHGEDVRRAATWGEDVATAVGPRLRAVTDVAVTTRLTAGERRGSARCVTVGRSDGGQPRRPPVPVGRSSAMHVRRHVTSCLSSPGGDEPHRVLDAEHPFGYAHVAFGRFSTGPGAPATEVSRPARTVPTASRTTASPGPSPPATPHRRNRTFGDSVDKDKALDLALANIEKQFGKGSLMKLGDAAAVKIPSIPTGALSLDIALGIGGLPRGRVVEIYGPESSGKTTVALHVVAEAQKLGGIAAFIDAEHALDPTYARALGVDINDLLVSQPDNGEQALEIADMLVRSAAVDVIVVDSVAALTPRAEIEGEMGDSHVGLQARLMSQALRKLSGNIKRSNAMVIFINQIRMKIGVMFGSPETTTGGNALKFYSSVRLDIRRIGAIKKGDEVIGNQTRVKVVKNKVSPPFKQAEFEILYGEGISREGEIIELGVANGIIEKAGSWYSYGEDRIGQGKENVREYLKEHPDTAAEIEGRIRELLLPPKQAPEEPEPEIKEA